MRYKGRIILGILLVFILATGNLFVQAQETDAERAYRISSIKSRYKTPNSRTGTSGYKFYFKALKHIEKQEYPAAIEFLNKGVSLGNFDSRLTLARMYRTGKGIEQNQKKALEMYCSLSEDNFL